MNLLEPDAHPRNPYGWLTNQSAHFANVGVPAGLIMFGLGLGPMLGVSLVALIYFVGWEQLAQGSIDLGDSVSDTVHVVSGAAFVYASLSGGFVWCVGVFAVWSVLLAVGVLRRL